MVAEKSFDIHQLDDIDDWEEFEKALDPYIDALLDRFFNSPEGQEHLRTFPQAGYWVDQLISFGYSYLGVALPRMSKKHVEEIVTEIFPRKVSLLSPDQANDAIPELLAFWRYLEREHGFKQANAVLASLKRIAPDFMNIMNDPSKFGMAKSLVMMGQEAGFDMTREEDVDAFMRFYNASVSANGTPDGLGGASGGSRKSSALAKRKKKRKAEKAARKKSSKK